MVNGLTIRDNVRPGLRSGNGVSLGASAIPGIDSAGCRDEASSRHTRVDDSCLEDIRVGGGEDILYES